MSERNLKTAKIDSGTVLKEEYTVEEMNSKSGQANCVKERIRMGLRMSDVRADEVGEMSDDALVKAHRHRNAFNLIGGGGGSDCVPTADGGGISGAASIQSMFLKW